MKTPMKAPLRHAFAAALVLSFTSSALPQGVPVSQFPATTALAPTDTVLGQTNVAAGAAHQSSRTITVANLLASLTNCPGWSFTSGNGGIANNSLYLSNTVTGAWMLLSNGTITATGPTNSFGGTVTAAYIAANGLLLTNVPWASISAAPAFDPLNAALNATNGLLGALNASATTGDGAGLTNVPGSALAPYASIAGPIGVGTGVASNSTDAMITISRMIADTNSALAAGANAHSFSDSTIWMKSTNAFASYDARVNLNNTNWCDHYAAFQAAPTMSMYNPNTMATNGLTNLYSFFAAPVVNAGYIGSYYGLKLNAPTLASGAIVSNLTAIYTGGGNVQFQHGYLTILADSGTDIILQRTNYTESFYLGYTDNGTKRVFTISTNGASSGTLFGIDTAGHVSIDAAAAYHTNHLMVGGNVMINTNLVVQGITLHSNIVEVLSNSLAMWPAAPAYAGAYALVNSNGYPFILLSTNGNGGGSASWTGTNKLSW